MVFVTGTQSHPKYTAPLYGLAGKYTLSHGVTLPYCLCAMPIERVIGELKVHEQLSPSLENTWTLRELFQREIDIERVKNELVRGYLNDSHKLKFFNALTIVLMPKDAEGRILEAFPVVDYVPPIPQVATDEDDLIWAEHPRRKDLSFGGVQYIVIDEQSRIRWNPELVHAVAVDGQHRLRALQLYYENEKNRTFLAEERDTKIPILFVLIAPQAGFENEVASIRSISRELFTDLNKNAKKVDRARELILDDWAIIPKCVRTLVTEDTAKDSNEVLPLTLIRWQEPNNRFDQSYYLNSLVNLEVLVNAVLDIDSPKDPMKKEDVDRFIRSVNDSLSTTEFKLQCQGKDLEGFFADRYFEDGEQTRPFSRLPEEFLAKAVDNFKSLHRTYILQILMRFKPYRELLDYARSQNLIEGVFGKYYAQTKLHRGQIRTLEEGRNSSWFQEAIDSPSKEIERMKGSNGHTDWSFKTIFQKALVRLARVVEFENRGSAKLGGVGDLLQVLDRLHSAGLFVVERPLEDHEYGLWGFIALTTNGKIRVAQSTEDRILAILRLWYYANRVRAGEGKPLTPRQLLKHFSAESTCADWPGCDDAVEVLAKAVDVLPLHGGKNPSEVPDAVRFERVRRRVSSVLAAGILDGRLSEEVAEDI